MGHVEHRAVKSNGKSKPRKILRAWTTDSPSRIVWVRDDEPADAVVSDFLCPAGEDSKKGVLAQERMESGVWDLICC
eukprot:scaffold5828_cov168-Amphora_coffeaeformis.AAC.9